MKKLLLISILNLIAINLFAQPYIQNFYPKIATERDFVMIYGSNFSGTTAVKFGGLNAKSFKIVNDSTIKAIVGTGNSGIVTVVTPLGNASKDGFYYPNGCIKEFYNAYHIGYNYYLKTDGTLFGSGTNLPSIMNGSNGSNFQSFENLNNYISNEWQHISPFVSGFNAIRKDGSIWGMGDVLSKSFNYVRGDYYNTNLNGDYVGSISYEPKKIDLSNDWLTVESCYRGHSFAIKQDGSLWYLNDVIFTDSLSNSNESYFKKIGFENDWMQLFRNNGGLVTFPYYSLFDESLIDIPLYIKKRNGKVWVLNHQGELTELVSESEWNSIQYFYDYQNNKTITVGVKENGTLWKWFDYSVPSQIGIDSNWYSASIGIMGGNYEIVSSKKDSTLWKCTLDLSVTDSNLVFSLISSNVDYKVPFSISSDNFNLMFDCPSPYPKIDFFQPKIIKKGEELKIIGSYLIGITEVKIGGVVVDDFQVIGDSLIYVTIPEIGSGSHVISITNSVGETKRKGLMVYNPTESRWKQVSAGGNHTLALQSNGSLWGWGENNKGQLGNGTTKNYSNPQLISCEDWKMVSTGKVHTLAIKSDGTLWSWGSNEFGQLGIGNTINKTIPVKIGTSNNWISVSAGNNHSLALKKDGTLWVWGNNQFGQLGDGSNIDRNIPVKINNDNNWQTISAGGKHSLALKKDGSCWGWGNNEAGQLGDGTFNNSNFPVSTGYNSGNWIEIYAGQNSSAGVKSRGEGHNFEYYERTRVMIFGNGSNGGYDGLNTTIFQCIPETITNLQADEVCLDSSKLFSIGYEDIWYYSNMNSLPWEAINNNQTNFTQTKYNLTKGDKHFAFLNENGEIRLFGDNSAGQLGKPTTLLSSIIEDYNNLIPFQNAKAGIIYNSSTKSEIKVYTTHSSNGSTSQYSEYANNTLEMNKMFDTTFSNTQLYFSGIISPTKAFNWNNSNMLTSEGITIPSNGEFFSVELKSKFTPKETGTYIFGINSDDASDLFIDTNLVVSYYGGHGMEGYIYNAIDLIAGKSYTLKSRVQEYSGGEGLSLIWKRPSQSDYSFQIEEFSAPISLCQGNSGASLTLENSNTSTIWQKSTNYTSANPTWTTLTVTNTNSLNTGVLTTSTAYRVIANSCIDKDTTDNYVVVVSPKAIAGTAALNGTTSNIVCSGGSKSLKLTGSTGSIQWQTASTSTGPWTDIEGATTATYTFQNLTTSGLYRAKVSSGACTTVYSNAITITVKQPTTAGTISASSTALCNGSGATLTLSGSSGTILWQKSTNYTATTPTWATATGTTATLSTGALTASTAYRAVLSNSPCPSSTATMVTVTVSPKAVAGTSAVNNTSGLTVCKGGDKPIKLTGSAGSLQWQASTTSATTGFIDVSGATTQPYTFTNIQANTWYRAKLSSGVCPTVYSNVLAITAKTPTVAGTITTTSGNVCSGTTGKTLTLSGSSGTIAWQKSTNWTATTPTWASATGTTATLTTGALTASTAYRAVLKNAPCPSSTADYIVVNVDPKVVVKTITANVTSPTGATATTAICESTEKILTLGAGYVGSIQWQRATTATGPWTNIDGATSSTYTVSNPSIGANYFRVKLTSGTCSAGYTTAVPIYYKTCVSTIAVLDNNTHPESLNNTILNKTDAVQQKSNEQIETTPFDAITYPNPYENYFNVQLNTSSDEQVAIKVFDMLGKVVEEHTVLPSDLEALQLGKDLSKGEYSIQIIQGGNLVMSRAIKR